MKLLFDENLSRKLPTRLSDLYANSSHVPAFELLERPDREFRDFAGANEFIIVTTDGDFYELSSAWDRLRR